MTSIRTASLELVLKTPESVREFIAGLSEEDRAHLSADWLTLVRNADGADPWVHGFTMRLRTSDAEVGTAGYKGPPTDEGTVEIAYGVDSEHQRRGYATEAAAALVDYAFADVRVLTVIAHTLPESNASTHVLTKCGFANVGQVTDPDDGPVWRWEKRRV